jgi:hypothetical protein
MNCEIRRKLGAVLIAVSIIVAGVIIVVTGESGAPQIVSHKDLGHIHETVVVVPVTVHKRWLVPSFAFVIDRHWFFGLAVR